ncbi:MAG: hypothetical protein H7177_08895 [Rhizobacter sp.]|nr:hypothetical protein [Bacteriovorax sp.]
MKTLLLAALVLSISAGAQARSILVFKSVNKCQTYTKQEPVTVDVQEAQDGQSQLVIAYPLKGDAPVKIQTKKILPPPMNAGGSLRYVGKNDVTKENVTLALGIRPIKAGKLVGRGATLTLEKQDAIQLICTTVK